MYSELSFGDRSDGTESSSNTWESKVTNRSSTLSRNKVGDRTRAEDAAALMDPQGVLNVIASPGGLPTATKSINEESIRSGGFHRPDNLRWRRKVP